MSHHRLRMELHLVVLLSSGGGRCQLVVRLMVRVTQHNSCPRGGVTLCHHNRGMHLMVVVVVLNGLPMEPRPALWLHRGYHSSSPAS